MDSVRGWKPYQLVYFKLGDKWFRGMLTTVNTKFSEVFVRERWPKQRVLTVNLRPVPLTGNQLSR